jgi:hypothetical protein
MDGKLLLQQHLNNTTGTRQISLQYYAPGAYQFNVSDNSGIIQSGKLLKE